MKEEFDSSSLAWEIYKVLYKDAFGDCITQIDNIDFKSNERPSIAVEVKLGKEKYECRLGGETDFNFKPGYAYSRGGKYRKLIEEIEDNNEADRLKKILGLQYKILNISLMPQTGNLQGTKQNLGNDRLDTFVWALDQYYQKGPNLLMNHTTYQNMDVLKGYLNSFKDINDYCNKIYHIDEDLVSRLITSGAKVIDSPDRINEYLNLAYDFWKQKYNYLNMNLQERPNNKVKKTLSEMKEILDDIKDE